jgi:glycosyltransferase 2 family protein
LTIWVLYYFSTHFLIKAIVPNQYIGFKIVLTVLIMSSIGWAGPTQGGIGVFHILVSKALVINGFNVEISNLISLFLHTIFSSYDIFYGILATAYLFIFLRRFKTDPSVSNAFF